MTPNTNHHLLAWVTALVAYGLIDFAIVWVFGWRAGATFAFAGWLLLTANAIHIARQDDSDALRDLFTDIWGNWLAATGGLAVIVVAIISGAWLFGLALNGLAAPAAANSYRLGVMLAALFVLPACAALPSSAILSAAASLHTHPLSASQAVKLPSKMKGRRYEQRQPGQVSR